MAYALHIERPDGVFTIEEWNAPIEASNPTTGEVISLGSSPGDTEVAFTSGGFLGFGAKREWCHVFRFSHDSAIFNAPRDCDNPKNPVRQAAAALASRLGATIVGDEGEEYDW